MKVKLSLLAVFSIFILSYSVYAQTGTQVNTSGFGDPNNNLGFMLSYNNNLYAAKQNSSTGTQVWDVTELQAKIYVADYVDVGVKTWPRETDGNVAPTTLFGSRLKHPYGVAVDSNWIYVANQYNSSIDVFPINATGNALPVRSIKGNNTAFHYPSGVSVDGSWIYVLGYSSICVFPKNVDGNVAPTRLIQGANTNLSGTERIAVDSSWIYVTCYNFTPDTGSILVFPINATGNVSPTRTIQGANTNLSWPGGIAVDSSWIYVTNWFSDSIAVFPVGATGDIVPTRFIKGTSTTLSLPTGIAVDPNWIYVASDWNSISIFPIGGAGNIAPIRRIIGNITTLSHNDMQGIAVDANFIYAAYQSAIGVFGIGGSGNIAPTRLIKGSNTTLADPAGVAVDSNWIYVADSDRVAVFPTGASGDVAPARLVQGDNTTLQWSSGIAVDSNWIYVLDEDNMSIDVFPINATGNVAPTRTIKGENTTFSWPLGIAIDSDWIYVLDGDNMSIDVFPINATGNVAPTRTIKGTNTNLSFPSGIAVDSSWIYVVDDERLSVVVFPKSSSGDVAPVRIIHGTNTRLNDPLAIAVDSKWIYVTDSESGIVVFEIGASGNVAPARIIQGNLTTLQYPIAIAIGTPQQYTLTVTKDGAGDGTVTSSPAGIDCGSDCSESFDQGTSVILTATAASGSTFGGWSGDADCSDGVVTMDANKTCTATFNPQVVGYTLTVSKSGTGSGTVTSNPSGIDCGSDCSESYNQGTSVTLTATPASGSTFGGWTGDADCSDGVVTMDANKTCTATFNSQVVGYTLTVVKSGTGSGTVTSSPAGINCGDDCSETYSKVQKVKLTAKADANSTFAGWSGGGCSGTKTCTVTVNDAVTVTADFALKTPDISVAQTSLDFGSVKVGKKVTKTLKIGNNGTGDLMITLSGLEGTDFSIQGSSSVTIKAKKSYTLKVLFTPKSAGLETATLRVSSNDPDTPTLEISLTGTGQ